MDNFNITKISKLGKKRDALLLDNENSVENQDVTAEMPVTTLGIPKKKYSKIHLDSSVKNYDRCELEMNSPRPVYDKEGKNIGLFLAHPNDEIVSESVLQSCRYILKKSYLAHQELERVLDMKTTLGPFGTIEYMTRMIQQDRNLKLSMHYMLLAENARLTDIPQRIVSHETLPPFQENAESYYQNDSDSIERPEESNENY